MSDQVSTIVGPDVSAMIAHAQALLTAARESGTTAANFADQLVAAQQDLANALRNLGHSEALAAERQEHIDLLRQANANLSQALLAAQQAAGEGIGAERNLKQQVYNLEQTLLRVQSQLTISNDRNTTLSATAQEAKDRYQAAERREVAQLKRIEELERENGELKGRNTQLESGNTALYREARSSHNWSCFWAFMFGAALFLAFAFWRGYIPTYDSAAQAQQQEQLDRIERLVGMIQGDMSYLPSESSVNSLNGAVSLLNQQLQQGVEGDVYLHLDQNDMDRIERMVRDATSQQQSVQAGGGSSCNFVWAGWLTPAAWSYLVHVDTQVYVDVDRRTVDFGSPEQIRFFDGSLYDARTGQALSQSGWYYVAEFQVGPRDKIEDVGFSDQPVNGMIPTIVKP